MPDKEILEGLLGLLETGAEQSFDKSTKVSGGPTRSGKAMVGERVRVYDVEMVRWPGKPPKIIGEGEVLSIIYDYDVMVTTATQWGASTYTFEVKLDSGRVVKALSGNVEHLPSKEFKAGYRRMVDALTGFGLSQYEAEKITDAAPRKVIVGDKREQISAQPGEKARFRGQAKVACGQPKRNMITGSDGQHYTTMHLVITNRQLLLIPLDYQYQVVNENTKADVLKYSHLFSLPLANIRSVTTSTLQEYGLAAPLALMGRALGVSPPAIIVGYGVNGTLKFIPEKQSAKIEAFLAARGAA